MERLLRLAALAGEAGEDPGAAAGSMASKPVAWAGETNQRPTSLDAALVTPNLVAPAPGGPCLRGDLALQRLHPCW